MSVLKKVFSFEAIRKDVEDSLPADKILPGYQHIVRDTDNFGRACLRNSQGLAVMRIFGMLESGDKPEELAEDFSIRLDGEVLVEVLRYGEENRKNFEFELSMSSRLFIPPAEPSFVDVL